MNEPKLINMIPQFNFLQPQASEDLERFGGKGDGGYVMSRSLATYSDTLLSFGIGQNIDFEITLLKKNPTIKMHLYDHTIKVPSKSKILFNLLKSVYLRNFSYLKNYVDFYWKYNFLVKYATHYQNKVTNLVWNKYDLGIVDIFANTPSENLLIKIDIEGDEYKILPTVIRNLNRCSGLIIEFHHLDKCFEKFETFVKEIQLSHDLEHLHGNNYSDLTLLGLPEVLELTFIKKEFNKSSSAVNELPNKKLDYPNSSWRRDFHIIFN